MSHDQKIRGASLSVVPSRQSHRVRKEIYRCNLCAEEFKPTTIFDRYCHVCKKESELLKFSEWLPELDAAITERISA